MKMKISILALCLAAGSFVSMAQSDWVWHQYAYFGDSVTNESGVWVSADYEILSNQLSNALVSQAIFDGKITSETTAGFEDLDTEKYLRFTAGTNGELWARGNRKGKWRWLFGVGYKDQAYVTVKTGLAQLYLKGNAPFENEQLPLGPSEIIYHSYQYAGLGIEHGVGPTTWGITAQMIKSSRYANLLLYNSSIFTSPYGTSIDADIHMRYDITNSNQSKLAAWYGTGYSLNGYFIYKPSKNSPLISFQLKDFGQVFYQGMNRLKLSDSLKFEGVDVNNVLQVDDSLIGGGNLDSLESLIGLTSAHPFVRASLPAHIKVNYVHPLGEKAFLNLELKQYLGFGVPQLRAGLSYRLASWFTLEPCIRVGGFSRFDVGLTAAVQLKQSFQMIVKTEQFEQLIAPKKSTGQSLFVGAQWKF